MSRNDIHTEENNELYEHHRIVVDPGQQALRIDKFLMNRIENASRNKIQNAARAGNILVNQNEIKPNYKVRPGDEISVLLPEPPKEIEVIPENITLNIVYEDKDIILINKKAGMVVHPAYANYTGTMLNALAFHLKHKKHQLTENAFLVHRIDKDTSGLIMAAKNEIAQSKLASQFFHHTIERKYIALVWGDFIHKTGTITGYLGRDRKDRRMMSVYDSEKEGKHAVTHYKVLERFNYVSLVECQLETGRTHQIRAHFKHIGHPLFNDSAYGGDKILKGTTFSKYKQFVQNCFKIIPRQALHAKSLGFFHPSLNKTMLFETELPDDLKEVINKWGKYTRVNV